jgi:hypothetical protein
VVKIIDANLNVDGYFLKELSVPESSALSKNAGAAVKILVITAVLFSCVILGFVV